MTKKIVSRIEFAALAGVSAPSVTKACGAALKPAVSGKRIDAAHPAAVEYIKTQIERSTPGAATGLDPLYEQAVETCQKHGRWTASTLQRQMKIGYQRAARLIRVIGANGLIPEPGKPSPAPPSPQRPKTKAAKAAKAPPPEDDDGVFEVPEDIQQFADMTLRELIGQFGTDTRFLDWLNATQKIEAINEKRLKNAETEGKLISRELVKNAIIDQIDSVFVQMLTDGAKTMSGRAHAIARAGGEVDEVKKMVEDHMSSLIRPAKTRMARALRNA